VMDRVVIGMDPHKASVTIEARDAREVLRATGRFGTDTRQYQAMLRVAHQWPERLWAGSTLKSCPQPRTDARQSTIATWRRWQIGCSP
jgi:hypothetical protein